MLDKKACMPNFELYYVDDMEILNNLKENDFFGLPSKIYKLRSTNYKCKVKQMYSILRSCD